MNPTASSARTTLPSNARASSEPPLQSLSPLDSVPEGSTSPADNSVSEGSASDGSVAHARASSRQGVALSEVLEEDAHAVVVAIPASPEFVRVVRLAVAGVATRMRFSYEQVEDIKLAVSEACNNAILHAEPPSGQSPTQVVVRLRPLSDRLEITVFDQGHLPGGGLAIPSSGGGWRELDDMDDLPEGGMGLMLIQSLMDEVSSHTGAPDHTALHMVKVARHS